MKYLIYIGFFLLICCQTRQEPATVVNQNVAPIKQDTVPHPDTTPTTPYWGYRFKIEGDFDGNGSKEILSERFYSQKTKRETYKYLKKSSANGFDCNASLVDNNEKKAVSYMVCSDSTIRRMPIGTCSTANAMFGVCFMKNVGDLNGDGSDELIYMEDMGCTTAPRPIYLITYQNGNWKRTRQWPSKFELFPALPEVRQKDQIFKQFSKEIRSFHQALQKAPTVIKKKNDKFYYCEFQAAKAVWKELKINW